MLVLFRNVDKWEIIHSSVAYKLEVYSGLVFPESTFMVRNRLKGPKKHSVSHQVRSDPVQQNPDHLPPQPALALALA